MTRKRLASLAAVLALGIATCCTTGRDLTRLEQMTEQEAAAFNARTAATAGALARTAYLEGDLSQESALEVAAALRTLSQGSSLGVGGTVIAAIDLDGYGALALQLALIQLDEALAAGGGADGLMTERRSALLVAVAAALEAAVQP
jgi:starvation-inducible outer membrane lipoprotein